MSDMSSCKSSQACGSMGPLTSSLATRSEALPGLHSDSAEPLRIFAPQAYVIGVRYAPEAGLRSLGHRFMGARRSIMLTRFPAALPLLFPLIL